MKPILIIGLVLVFAAPLSFAGSFEECILSKMPGTANDQAAFAINKLCRDEATEIATKKTGWFRWYKSGAECMAAKGKDTQSRSASMAIASSCYVLYEPGPPSVLEGMKLQKGKS
ncbi:hypothetical protein HNQ50_000807 [Silvimonas terrae]|uniref:Uncharacterized protein n=1 Tax=Silvimonas terrae TaxID=300266 RepID=A0A840RB10_9NEIS|nr:hypothetical protein [Silvimonas terrae]MBB5190097.1 hypothetical protein [Silvimonas terrae]